MKNQIIKLSFLILVLLIPGCKEPAKKQDGSKEPAKKQGCCAASKIIAAEQVLKINIGGEPQTLDPRKVRGLRDINLSKFFMEGLTRTGKNGKAELALASEYQVSEDLKTYTFTLRSSKWSNGDPLTAQDFMYAWKKSLSPDFPSDYASQLYVIKNAKNIKSGALPLSLLGAQTPDEKTLIIELEYPTPYLLDLLALPICFPINSKIDRKNPTWSESAETFIGNGPFLLEDWKHNNQLLGKKNPLYWDADAVKIEQIDMVMVSEETGFNMFENNDLQWEGSPFSIIPLDAIKELNEQGKVRTSPFLGTYWIRINVDRAPFNNATLRKAFALAIDRKAIVEHVTQGNQIPATGIVPLDMELQDSPYFADADHENAKNLFEEGLAQLNLKKEKLPEITLSYGSGERNHRIAQAVQQQWLDTFGIKAVLEPLEAQVYLDHISKQNYMLGCGSWIADFDDPINFLEVFKTKNSGTNNTNWENSDYTSLLEKSYLAKDPEERKTLLKEAEKILIDEMPTIPVFYYTMLHVQNPAIKDVVLSNMGIIDFKWAYIDHEEIAKAE